MVQTSDYVPAGVGTGTWTNPTNCYAHDSNWATAAPGKSSDSDQIFTTFGISDPGGTTRITKLEIGVDWYVSTTSSIATQSMWASWDGGTNWAGASMNTSETEAHTADGGDIHYFDVTGGHSWTWTELNNTNLRVRGRATRGNSSTAVTFYYNVIYVRVTYTMEKTTTLDSYSRFKATLTTTLNSLSRYKKTQTTTLDSASRFRKTQTSTLDSYSRFKKSMETTLDSASRFKKTMESTLDSDSRFLKTQELTLYSDSTFAAGAGATTYTFTLDSFSRFLKEQGITLDSDSRFLKTQELTLTSYSKFTTGAEPEPTPTPEPSFWGRRRVTVRRKKAPDKSFKLSETAASEDGVVLDISMYLTDDGAFDDRITSALRDMLVEVDDVFADDEDVSQKLRRLRMEDEARFVETLGDILKTRREPEPEIAYMKRGYSAADRLRRTKMRDPSMMNGRVVEYEKFLVTRFEKFKQALTKAIVVREHEETDIDPEATAERIRTLSYDIIVEPSEKWVKTQTSKNYKAGQARADQFLKASGMQATLSVTPQDMAAIEVLQTRNLTNLEGITDEMDKSIINTISEDMLNGEGIDQIAQDIVDDVDDIGIVRARLIARTETMYAFNTAALNEYEKFGVEAVEWLTAPDERTCDECASLDGERFPITTMPDIPKHPNCRCVVLPVLPEV